jgi:hypothetical protein
VCIAFRPKAVAFRNDFCLTCGVARRAVQVRTFNVLDWHGIPLIPVGFWKRWQCVSCGSNPEYNRRGRRKFAIALALLAAAFAAIFWGLPSRLSGLGVSRETHTIHGRTASRDSFFRRNAMSVLWPPAVAHRMALPLVWGAAQVSFGERPFNSRGIGRKAATCLRRRCNSLLRRGPKPLTWRGWTDRRTALKLSPGLL